MNSLFALSVLLAASSSLAAPTLPTRLDPALRMAASQTVVTPALSKRLNIKAAAVDGMAVADVFVKTSDIAQVEARIAAWGGTVRSVIGNILTADVPLAYVAELAALDVVEYVEAAKPVQVKLNQSVPIIEADMVHDMGKAIAVGLPQAFTGAGIIVGVVDSGIDCSHADFTDGAGNTRLLSYWDQTTGISGEGVGEINNSFGTEYHGVGLTDGTCTTSPDGDPSGHGTHVAGIATSSHATYRGVAPGASIIAVKHNAQDAKSDGTFATMVVDAVNYIFRKAQTLQMPAVVNLSLGTSLGAHDDSSLFEQALNALLQEGGSDKQGRAIVNAAGNENFSSADSEAGSFGGIHALIDQANAAYAFDFVVRSSSTVFTGFGGAQVDIWLDAGSDCTVEVDAYSKSSKSSSALRIDMAPVMVGSASSATSNSDGKFQIGLDFSDAQNANNGKQHALVTIMRAGGGFASAGDYSFDLIFIGTCTGDAWLYPDLTSALAFRKVVALPVASNAAGYDYLDGDSNRTMTIPSTASKVLAIGSFMGAGTWTDINGNVHDQTSTGEGTGGTAGAISLFSSLGPTADGRTKPDLTAPGEPIISTLASNVNAPAALKGDSTHHKLEGTSMSTPHVAGTIALMLERNGCLTPTEIKNHLTSTTTTDGFTGGGLPNNTWGAGKLNALMAVQSVSDSNCVPDNPSENGAADALTDSSGPGGPVDVFKGGGSCSLIPPSSRALDTPSWLQ